MSDLRAVLYHTQQAIQCRNDTSQDCGSLSHIVKRAGQAVGELNYLIEHHLVSSGHSHGLDEKPQASRAAFLRHGRKIRDLKLEIQEVKLSLLVAVGTLVL